MKIKRDSASVTSDTPSELGSMELWQTRILSKQQQQHVQEMEKRDQEREDRNNMMNMMMMEIGMGMNYLNQQTKKK